MKTANILTIVFCVIFAFITVTGLLFRRMHWPFGKEMLYTGISGLVLTLVSFAAVVVLRSRKESDQ